MKNLPLILSSVALAAVIALFILFFAGKKEQFPAETSGMESLELPQVSGGIVYVNIDSVLNNYDMYADIQGELQEKLKTSEAQLAAREKALRKDMQDFQYKIDRQLVTRAEAEKLQQELMQQEQALYQLQNNLQVELAEMEQVAQRKVLNSIMEYLGGLEDADQYQYILGTTFGGNILYANENLNITKTVVNGINEKYVKGKEDDD
ncbi:MAG: OmpH family outer membrane protein [Bacteroidales bacterium]|jgi:outer membrane protein